MHKISRMVFIVLFIPNPNLTREYLPCKINCIIVSPIASKWGIVL
jgi:hypothetical protein